MKKQLVFIVGGILLGLAGTSWAYPITNPADPALFGATVIDFESQTLGTYLSLAIGGVTFTADDYHLRIGNEYAGQYNNPGRSLDNGVYGDMGFSSMTVSFASTVSAFGFNWGASDEQWLLTAYDASDNLLESYSLPITYASNNGDFVGLAVNGIDHAVLSGSSGDWIFVDNFAYVTGVVIPAPGAVLLGTIGVSLVGWLRRRRAL